MTPRWLQDPTLQQFFAATRDAGGQARAVGGAVRDFLMGRDAGDVDLASTLLPERTMEIAVQQGWKAVPTGIEHGTVTLVLPGRVVEVTTLRRDVATDGRHATVAFTDDWREDAARRDFTINALSMDASGALYDYFDGQADIAARRVRFIGDAATRIAEDGLRILRFFRFLASHGTPPADADALAACTASKEMIARLSGERITNEMRKLLQVENPAFALRLMADTGIAHEVFLGEITPSRMIRLAMLEAQADYQTSVWARVWLLIGALSGAARPHPEFPQEKIQTSPKGEVSKGITSATDEPLPGERSKSPEVISGEGGGAIDRLIARWKLSRHEAQQLKLLAGLNEPSPCKGEGRVGVKFRQHYARTIKHARELRANATDVEKMLWKKLARRQTGHYFRRQHPIESYIVDFVCIERKLVIELDGGQHASQTSNDSRRTAVIASAGYRVVRFWNHEVLENLEGVYASILSALADTSTAADPHPTLPLAEGGLSVAGEFHALPRHVHTRIIRLHGAPVYLDWLLVQAAITPGIDTAPYVHLAHDFTPPTFPVTAKDLMARGMKEGKALGETLSMLEQKWEESDYTLTKEALLTEIK